MKIIFSVTQYMIDNPLLCALFTDRQALDSGE
jgi:hypothetical protein